MKVLVISGFLGAGKTTFIRELAKRTGKDFVVYENEYGQTDLDAEVLRSDAELEVWASTENCICCSGKQDFASSILTISNTLDPEYLVVEPTGMAKLSSVMDNVRQIGYERIELLEPVCILDAWMWSKQRARCKDIFDDQIQSASMIAVSKIGSSHEALSDLGLDKLLEELAPETSVVFGSWDDIPDDWWNALLVRYLDKDISAQKLEEISSERVHIEQFALSHTEVPSPAHLLWILDNMVRGLYGQIDRAKGVVRCGNQTLRFDLVGSLWAITGAENTEETHSVFIGPEFNRIALREFLVPMLWRQEDDLVTDEHLDCHDHNHSDGNDCHNHH